MGPLHFLLQMYHTTNPIMSLSVVPGGKKIDTSNTAKDIVHKNNPLYGLFRLVLFHVIDGDEIYTLVQLRNFHQSTEENSASSENSENSA